MKTKLLILCIMFISVNGKQAINYINNLCQEKVKFHSYESIDSNKKIERKAILVKKPHAKANILICHGYTTNKYDISFLHMMFPDYNTLTFDFRAHGENIDNQFCTFGRNESYDVLAACEFIKTNKELRDLPLICYGFSMGAVSSIIAQAVHRNLFDAMILDCPFDSTDNLIERALERLNLNLFGYKMPLPGRDLFKGYAYVPYVQNILKSILSSFTNMDTTKIETLVPPVYPNEAIKYVKAPCYFISCINDDKVPESAILSIYNNAPGFKRLWLTDGRRHYDTVFYRMHDYFYKINRFILKFLNNELKNKPKSKIIRDFKPHRQLKTKKAINYNIY